MVDRFRHAQASEFICRVDVDTESVNARTNGSRELEPETIAFNSNMKKVYVMVMQVWV